jgi:glycosyltransferase involved in cell wall biosynthesis
LRSSMRTGPTRRSRAVWLSWHDSTRSRNLAGRLGVEFHAFTGFATGPLRHALGSLWTCERLLRLRPTTILLQSSFLLLLIVGAYKRLATPVFVVADCHNKALERRCPGPLSGMFMWLKRWSFRQVDLTVVSNAAMLVPAHALAQAVLVLRDPLPREFDQAGASSGLTPPRPYVLFPCSFESDEPVEVIIKTVELLSRRGIATVVTGDDRGAWRTPDAGDLSLVSRPGFVPFPRYRDLVVSAAAIVVLTTDQRCLMCGAYEALAAGRPLIVSDTPTLRACFENAAAYVPNDPARILDAVVRCVAGAELPPPGSRDRFVTAFEREFAELARSVSASGIPVPPPAVATP